MTMFVIWKLFIRDFEMGERIWTQLSNCFQRLKHLGIDTQSPYWVGFEIVLHEPLVLNVGDPQSMVSWRRIRMKDGEAEDMQMEGTTPKKLQGAME